MEIAFLQFEVVKGERAVNCTRVEKLIDEYFSTGNSADIFLLPELWSTGYSLKELNLLASQNGDEDAEFLGNLAIKYGVWFAGGSVAAKTDAGIFNRSQIIDRSGKLQAVYDKIHLVPMLDEPRYMVAGNKRCVHDIEGVRFGFAICYDLRFCELLRALALDGAEVLMLPAQWPTLRGEHWKALLKARAIENQYYLFASNNTVSGEDGFVGHSIAIAPDGTTLSGFESETGVKSALVDTTKVKKLREMVPVIANRRPELY